jgi:hypothetical protein
MWESTDIDLGAGGIVKINVMNDGRAVSYRRIIDSWRADEAFRRFFISLLAEAPFSAYLWETPPVTRDTMDHPFEFVLVDNKQLANAQPDARAFDDQFRSAPINGEVVAFSNLSGDALLVAPCPRTSDGCYAHLATFSRNAPLQQQHLLWQLVGETIAQRLDEHPLWISTSGLGVYWLHVRLDAYPKYYAFEPYRKAL